MTRARKDRRIRIVQDSPFLNLPTELREQIYYYVLVRPIPIDLWPLKYKYGPPSTPVIRLQEDLLFVRKEMATGLLTTCRQLYNEAGDIFWSRNTFRFSGDIEWFGARRFLGQIGPRALSRIQSLELFAPLADAHCLEKSSSHQRNYDRMIEFYVSPRTAKNMPKMHMIKVQKEPWTGKFLNWQGLLTLEHTSFVLTRNVHYICHLMDMAKTSLDLKFILPEGFGFHPPHGPAHGTNGRWIHVPGQRSNWVQENGLQLPEDLSRLLPLLTKSVTLVIEPGASLYRLELPEHFTKIGINVLCQPGSLFPASPSQSAPTISSEPKLWMEPSAKFDYLLGISMLFEEPQEISVAARGGKTTTRPGPRSFKRILKGFGGCRFIEDDRWACVCPPSRGDKSQNRGRFRLRGEESKDDYHRSEGQCSVEKSIVIKKRGRAYRKGTIGVELPTKDEGRGPEHALDRAPDFEIWPRCTSALSDSDFD